MTGITCRAPRVRPGLGIVASTLATGAVLLTAGTAAATQVTAIDIGFLSDNIITFDTADPTNHTLISTTTRPIFGMDYSSDKKTLYCVDNDSRELLTLNDATGVFTPVAVIAGVGGGETFTGISVDPTDETLYLSATDGGNASLYTVNTTTAAATFVGSMGIPLNIDISINCEGEMYGHDIGDDMLYSIDKTNGVATAIGLTGFSANFAQGMDFDPTDGTLYACLYQGGGDNRFVTFNLATGAATEQAAFAGEFEMAVKGNCPGGPIAGQDRGTPSDKGSFLVYPKVELRWLNAPPYPLIQDTFVHLTNDYPDDLDVKMYFVQGDAPVFSTLQSGGFDLEGTGGRAAGTRESRVRDTETGEAGGGGGDGGRNHPGWNWLDNVITLTANEPAYWSASSGLPKGVSPWATLDPGPPPGRPDPNNANERHLRGYIVAFAINRQSGEEIRWNHLAGDATIVNYANECAWQYGAVAFAAIPRVDHGMQTGDPGRLAFDGVEFSQAPSMLLMNFIASGADAYSGGGLTADHDTDLTVLPFWIDHRQETNGPTTTKVSFDIWNENEVKFTNLDRCVTCWDQELLSNHAIPNHFLVGSLHTDAGKARLDGLQSFLCPESRTAPLLGVAAKLIALNGGKVASGNNLFGAGLEEGRFKYDTQGPPPETRTSPGPTESR